MNYATYTKQMEIIGAAEAVPEISSISGQLLGLISRNKYGELNSKLPVGWQENSKVVEMTELSEVSKYFKNFKESKNGKVEVENKVIAIVSSGEYKVGKISDYYRTDYKSDSTGKTWRLDDEMSSYIHAEFQVEFKLIWVIKDMLDEQKPLKICVYIPTEETLKNVEYIQNEEAEKVKAGEQS